MSDTISNVQVAEDVPRDELATDGRYVVADAINRIYKEQTEKDNSIEGREKAILLALAFGITNSMMDDMMDDDDYWDN